ncbi:hypothetical protein MTO96_031254 [Rhipicephalus appendiculatus]
MGTWRVSAPRLGNGRGARDRRPRADPHCSQAPWTRTAPGMQRQESGTDAIGELHAGTGLAPKFNLIKRSRAALCERSLADRLGGPRPLHVLRAYRAPLALLARKAPNKR